MKTRRPYLSRALLTAGAFALMTASGAFASTAPCTPITNTATLKYKVGAVDQTDITSASNAANSFNVGVKVFVTVANQDSGNVTAVPGTTPSVLKFEVENTGNGVHDYALAIEPTATSPHGGADTFDATAAKLKIYVDTNGNGIFDSGTDTETSTINNLARDNGKIAVFVVYTPDDLSQPNGAIAAYNLKATALWADGTAITENVLPAKIAVSSAQQGTCNGESIDVVFGDAAGTFTGDVLHDATHSDDSAYIVSSATIGVTKGFTVISDPVNLAVNPKAIPGAVVRYSIAIANTGTAPALLSTISDLLANTLQIIPAGATWNVPASTRGVTTKSGTLTADTGDGNGDGLAHTLTTAVGGTVTATMTTILAADTGYAAGELKAGETVTVTFDATVQ